MAAAAALLPCTDYRAEALVLCGDCAGWTTCSADAVSETVVLNVVYKFQLLPGELEPVPSSLVGSTDGRIPSGSPAAGHTERSGVVDASLAVFQPFWNQQNFQKKEFVLGLEMEKARNALVLYLKNADFSKLHLLAVSTEA